MNMMNMSEMTMKGYCDQCENHCPLDAPRCGRGRRMAEGDRGGEFRDERSHGPRPHDDFHGERPHGPRPHDEFHGERPHGPRPHDDAHGERPHGPRSHDDFRGERPHGPRPHDDFPGEPPHGPRPGAEELQRRVASGSLRELMEMCGHILHHHPGAGMARGQSLALAVLAERGAMPQRELQDRLGVQPGSMSELLQKMERKGLLTRERGEDRRGNLLRVTEAGRAAAAEAESAPADDLFSALTPEQQAQLAELLRPLLADWIARFERRPHRHPGARPEPDAE